MRSKSLPVNGAVFEPTGGPVAQSPLAWACVTKLPADMDTIGPRAAAEAFAENDCLSKGWALITRARLAQRLAVTQQLPAEEPRRWIADRLRDLLAFWWWLDEEDRTDATCVEAEHDLERVYDRVNDRTETLYQLIDYFLDQR